ncbi:MAG: SMR family transporter [Bacillota bacterium]|nr:SMR family transporter [Bacillota bacterium]
MINLILAVVMSAMISVIMRLSGGKCKANISMLAANYIMCSLLAISYIGFDNVFPVDRGLGNTPVFGVINGFLYPMGFILMQMNVKKNGVVLSATFMKLGLLVPMAIAICFFGERPSLIQITGFVVAIVAILMINVEPTEKESKFKFGLILLLFAGGITDSMSKIFEELGNTEFSGQFLFYTFFLALLFCLVLAFFKKERPGKAEIFYGLALGLPNYFSAKCLLKSLESIPAVIAYPVYSVATILVVTLVGIFFFKEKLSKVQWLALFFILVALTLLNL